MIKDNINKFILIAFLLFATSTFAQVPIFNDDVPDNSAAAPISSIVALGLIAGAAYGIKKIKAPN